MKALDKFWVKLEMKASQMWFSVKIGNRELFSLHNILILCYMPAWFSQQYPLSASCKQWTVYEDIVGFVRPALLPIINSLFCCCYDSYDREER